MYLLDTSALIDHFRVGAGYGAVRDMIASDLASVCTLSWFEFGVHLRDVPDRQTVLASYRRLIASTLDVTIETALEALELRSICASRVPAVDAMIAATARRHRLTLVHRDKHLSQIPASWLPQIFLDGSSR